MRCRTKHFVFNIRNTLLMLSSVHDMKTPISIRDYQQYFGLCIEPELKPVNQKIIIKEYVLATIIIWVYISCKNIGF